MQLSERHQEYWRKNLRLTAVLLAVWFVVTFVVIYFAPQLNNIVIMGFPSPSTWRPRVHSSSTSSSSGFMPIA